MLILVFGVDYRYVQAGYIDTTLRFGFFDLPLRMVVPFVVSLLMLGGCCSCSCRDLHRPRHHCGGAGSARAAADGGRPDQDQAHRVRDLDCDRLDRRRAS